MTLPRPFFPSVKNCQAAGCPNLVCQSYTKAYDIRVRWICKLTGKIPGNMGICPTWGRVAINEK